MATMDPERLAEIDRAIEALGTPAAQVRVDGGLDLAEVDRLLDDLAQGVQLPAIPTASRKADADATTSRVNTATESSPNEGVADASPSPALGLDADDLFGDVQGSDASAPLEIESPERTTEVRSEPTTEGAELALEGSELPLDLEVALEGGDEDQDEDQDAATGLFSTEDIEAIRRSSAPPPPDAEPFDDEALVTPPLPSTPPPPPADALAASQPAAEEFDEDLDGDLDALMDDDFELMIEDELENSGDDEDDPTFIGSVADFQAQLASDEAAATNAETAPSDTEENHVVEDGDGDNDGDNDGDDEKKGFFKKLFG